MTIGVHSDFVIALDYYDGEVEGFACCGGECSYFMRLDVDDDDIKEYASVLIDCSLFQEIVGSLENTDSPSNVFVYSGSVDRVNRRLDELVPALRTRLEQDGRRLRGRSYLEAQEPSNKE